MAWDNTQASKPTNFKIFVVTIDGIVEKIEATYITGVRDFVVVPLNEARRVVEKLGDSYCIATDDESVAEQYGIKLIKTKYQ
mgnify:CR=1 FL=1